MILCFRARSFGGGACDCESFARLGGGMVAVRGESGWEKNIIIASSNDIRFIQIAKNSSTPQQERQTRTYSTRSTRQRNKNNAMRAQPPTPAQGMVLAGTNLKSVYRVMMEMEE